MNDATRKSGILLYSLNFIISKSTLISNEIFRVFGHNRIRGEKVEHNHYLRAVGLGMLAGAAVGMMVSPGRTQLKRTANKAVQAVGNAAENLSEAMNMNH